MTRYNFICKNHEVFFCLCLSINPILNINENNMVSDVGYTQVCEQTWCPICKQGELQENCQLIYCTGCELQLSKDDEINVVTLRNRLADVHTEHLDRGCRLKPKFRLETSFGLTALYIFCQGCSTFEVVIQLLSSLHIFLNFDPTVTVFFHWLHAYGSLQVL